MTTTPVRDRVASAGPRRLVIDLFITTFGLGLTLAPLGCGGKGSGPVASATAVAITTQPASQEAVDGSSVTFTVVASGNNLSYQWRKNDQAIWGAQSATYTTPPVSYHLDRGARYTVQVSSGDTSLLSGVATLTVKAKPTTLSGLEAQAVQEGSTATFRVTAAGTSPFTYQWFRNNLAVSGATQAEWTTGPVSYAQDHGAVISVQVTNPAGTMASSNTTLTVVPPTTVLSGLADVTVDEGAPATFAIQAAGSAPFTYQWRRNGSELPGATGTQLTLASPGLADDGARFSVRVTNRAGQVATSGDALLRVRPRSFTVAPLSDQTLTAGLPATFTATVTGTGPFTYQWRRNGLDLPGAQGATLVLQPTIQDHLARFQVLVTNASGTTVSSNQAQLTLVSNLTVTQAPQTQTVTAPDAPTFTVTTTGGLPRTYQWKVDGVAINGATGTSFTYADYTDLKTVPPSYTVVVSDGLSSVETAPVTFSVVAPKPYYPAAGAPVPVPSRPLTVVPSYYVDPVKFPDGAFQLGYDEALKNPAWTAYADFKVHAAVNDSSDTYLVDDRRPPLQEPSVAGSDMGTHGNMFFLNGGQGFDRGHMVAQADLTYRYGRDAGSSTNRMTNLVPQVSYNNQRIWLTLEQIVGGKFVSGTFNNGLAATFGRVWIYSGPVFTGATDFWVPSQDFYTKNPGSLPASTLAIAIPTANYKIVVAEPAAGQTLPRVLAWLGSNRPYDTIENNDVWKYTTTVRRIEELTGLQFFPGLTGVNGYDSWRETVDVRGWGSSFEMATGPNVHIVRPSWDLKPITTNPILKGEKVLVGQSVAFEAQAMPGAATPAATIAEATWTFGDSQTASGLTATHAYAAAGTYTVTFTATDSLGASNSITRTVVVSEPVANAAPTVGAIADVTVRLGNTPAPVTFTVSDDTTLAGDVTVTVTNSSNPSLVATGNITVANVGGTVTLGITPETGVAGSTTLTVTASDQDGATGTRTFMFSVVTNTPPTFAPSTLPDVTTAVDTAKQVSFTVADDDLVTAPTVTAESSNTTLLPNGNITLVNTAGSIALTLTPASGQTGETTLTVTATDSNGATTVKTFKLTVQSAVSGPVLIISQYYEGTSNNKWIEVTNIGTSDYDSVATPRYLGLWVNVGAAFQRTLIPNLAAGATMLFKNGSAVLPSAANLTTVPTVSNSTVINFNGNDPVFITTVDSTTSTAWDARVDTIGDGTWSSNPGADKSFFRNAGATPSVTWQASQWTQRTNAQVDSAAADDSARLGFHIK